MKLNYILEKFDEPNKTELKSYEEDENIKNSYSFKIDDNEYEIEVIFDKKNKIMTFMFGLKKYYSKPDSYSMLYSPTNTGHVKKVFSTVLNALKNDVDKYKPLEIGFSTIDKKLFKFYKMLVSSKEIKEKFPNYEVSSIKEKNNGVDFYIKRKI